VIVLDLAKAPGPIRLLVDWLNAQGFLVVGEQSADVFNQFAEFSSGERHVIVRADRGEWDVPIGLVTMKGDHLPDAWEAYLDGVALGEALSDLAHQVDFIMNGWPDAVEKASASPDAEAQLRRIEDDFVRRRFGFSPPKA
jgi:hypothetical protein